MRQAKILYKGDVAGVLVQHDDGSFTFRYGDLWLADSGETVNQPDFAQKCAGASFCSSFSILFQYAAGGVKQAGCLPANAYRQQ